MPKAWLLPEHTADVLPNQAADVEHLRRLWVDTARSYGYQLVIPPLVEHLDSLLTGAGRELDLRTVKVVDQVSGRTLGIRADMTPQAARIDAHMLNRQGPVRLSYCGPVLHARPRGLLTTRDPLQFGAELYGHAGLDADLEVLTLALDGLVKAEPGRISLDLADVRIVEALIGTGRLRDAQASELAAALATKDQAAVRQAARGLAADQREALVALTGLYGEAGEVLAAAAGALPRTPTIGQALADLQQLTLRLKSQGSPVSLGVDLANVQGFGYYSGISFAAYVSGHSDALVQGGRYDGLGAAFGRERPAVGFGLDLKELADLRGREMASTAIVAPAGDAPGLAEAIGRLRAAGETVVQLLPGQDAHADELGFDRKLIAVAGRWVVQAA
jgi:ATP phosphoribosyltransferase regulatory subunit